MKDVIILISTFILLIIVLFGPALPEIVAGAKVWYRDLIKAIKS